MTQHDDDTSRLRHMLRYAREAVTLAQGKGRADLDSSRMLELSLVRLLEIIGEAGDRVSAEGRESLAAIPWRQVINMRNRLIHGYDEVDLDILWDTITKDLPQLIIELERVLTSE